MDAQIVKNKKQLANIPEASVSYDRSFDPNAKRRTQLNSAIELDERALNKLNAELADWKERRQAASKTSFYGMHLGKTYNGRPVWDCGVKVNAKYGVPPQTPQKTTPKTNAPALTNQTK